MLRSLKQARYSEDKRRPLRPRRHLLHPLHLAHPPLSRPAHPPHLEGRAALPARAQEGKRHRRLRRPRPAERRIALWPASAQRTTAATLHAASKALVEAATTPRQPQPHPPRTLHDIAEEASQSERRADAAERELMEWKKMKFMPDRVGEDFDGLIISMTKYGIFVELTDLFVEGLIPLASLPTTAIPSTKTPARSSASAPARLIRSGDRSASSSTASTRWSGNCSSRCLKKLRLELRRKRDENEPRSHRPVTGCRHFKSLQSKTVSYEPRVPPPTSKFPFGRHLQCHLRAL